MDRTIQSLLIRERYYRDTNQWAKLRSSYHPDTSKTRIDITWYQGDIDGFVSGSRAMAASGTGAIHTISPVEIHLESDKALAESTGSVSIRFPYRGRSYDCVAVTRFISRLERVSGRWKLLSLEAIYDRDWITPVLPYASDNVLPLPVEGRESYKCISWVLSLRGFTIKPDLPGVDDPASCARLMEESMEWLYE
ncbi:hypothetical protein BO82DRAFT_386526 [Aspergillus uvarum CBS 121591]|uniref:SnoaL-like domain-containing protein n=1 Tax=Aspergillus uvarum CBS 121591 TaxID=1448315 RepID=A0A319BVB3_9EURO|nr:hypothetical protein BO82DRAFT_386526 [Aspergillus uvarum CBS 121591]PYH77646.1 hypothetical protein BO82DRAFT_386526 [Aspergillus uvarum CBS 121591]